MQQLIHYQFHSFKNRAYFIIGLCTFFIFFTIRLSAQPAIIEWSSSFKTSVYGISKGQRCPNNKDWFYNIIEISAEKGGGYIGVGFSEMSKCENNDIASVESYMVNGVTYYKQLKVYTPAIVRMDKNGKMVWEQVFNDPYPNGKCYLSDVVEVDDGFVACGSRLHAANENETLSVNNNQLSLFLAKVDVNGKKAKDFPKVFGPKDTISKSPFIQNSNTLPFSTGGYCSIRKVPNKEGGFIIGTADFTNKHAARLL